MRSKLNILISLFVGMLTLSSCNEDLTANPNNSDRDRNEMLPLIINVNMASDEPSTRWFGQEDKRTFSKDDLLHIIVDYTCKSIDGVIYHDKRYIIASCLGSNKWGEFEENRQTLVWPGDALSGSFKAYYIDGTHAQLNENTAPAQRIDNFDYTTCPLVGENLDVPYGHTIELQMKHLFSHLSFIDLEPGISERFWFQRFVETEDEQKCDPEFYNGIQFVYEEYNETYGGPSITPLYSQIKDDSYDGLVYISGKTDIYYNDNSEPKGKVGFFLVPGTYERFKLLYPKTSSIASTYINYTNSGIGDNITEFKNNSSYVFSVIRSNGLVVEEIPGNGWDTSEPVKVDVLEFMQAVNEGKEYVKDGQLILKVIEGGIELVRNVDFDFTYYDVINNVGGKDIFADLDKILDGGYHYIKNMVCPLLNTNDGNIKNLGIIGFDTSKEKINISERFNGAGVKKDFSQFGAIARSNTGNIYNLRARDINIEELIKVYVDETEIQSIGILIGSNEGGSVSKISLAGGLNLKVKNAEEENRIPIVYIGGIAGQNTVSIREITPLDANEEEVWENALPFINIDVKCVGEKGSIYVGGVVGNDTGNIENIELQNITIDCSESRILQQRIGGIAGRIWDSQISALILECSVGGSLKGGSCEYTTNASSYSYLGGLCGHISLQPSIRDCILSMDINLSMEDDENVLYSTGGVFGRVQKTENTQEIGIVTNIVSYGSELNATKNVGCFIGIAPSPINEFDFSWDNYYSPLGNNVRKYDNIDYIGSVSDTMDNL